MRENDTGRYSHTSSLERFNPDEERQALGIEVKESTRGRKNKVLVRDNSSQAGLTRDWTRASFIVRVEHLNKLKDFAYTNRIPIKTALDMALDRFLKDVNGLLPHDERGQAINELFRMSGEKTYTIKEVAAILKRAVISVQKYIKSGKLKATKVGNAFFISESDLKTFAKNHNFMV